MGEGSARLEQEVDALGAELDRRLEAFSPIMAELVRRVKVSGYVAGVWWDAQRDSQVFGERRQIWDARLFVDVRLAENLGPGESVWLRSAAASFEWNLVRLGDPGRRRRRDLRRAPGPRRQPAG